MLTIVGNSIPFIQLDPEYEIFNTVMAILNSARKGEKVLDEQGKVLVDFSDVETIAVDSITKLNDLLIQEIEEVNGVMRMQDWGVLRSRIASINSTLMSLKYNTLITGGEAIKDDQEDADKVRATLNMQGGYRDVIMYEYDFNIYMKTIPRGRSVKYMAYTQDMNKRTAKSRADLDPEIENLTYTMIAEAVKAKLSKGNN